MSAEWQFECDLEPQSRAPRVRFNFDNGWSASLLVRTSQCNAMLASVAAAPSRHWGEGKTELGPTEAFADAAIAWLYAVSQRARIGE